MHFPMKLYELVEAARQRLAEFAVDVAGYGARRRGNVVPSTPAHTSCRAGHVGDANLHLNVCDTSGYRPEIHEVLEPWVFEAVAACVEINPSTWLQCASIRPVLSMNPRRASRVGLQPSSRPKRVRCAELTG